MTPARGPSNRRPATRPRSPFPQPLSFPPLPFTLEEGRSLGNSALQVRSPSDPTLLPPYFFFGEGEGFYYVVKTSFLVCSFFCSEIPLEYVFFCTYNFFTTDLDEKVLVVIGSSPFFSIQWSTSSFPPLGVICSFLRPEVRDNGWVKSTPRRTSIRPQRHNTLNNYFRPLLPRPALPLPNFPLSRHPREEIPPFFPQS